MTRAKKLTGGQTTGPPDCRPSKILLNPPWGRFRMRSPQATVLRTNATEGRYGANVTLNSSASPAVPLALIPEYGAARSRCTPKGGRQAR